VIAAAMSLVWILGALGVIAALSERRKGERR
jgi:hypothetical protein